MNELPEKFQKRILRELSQLRKIPGKTTLTFEMNSDMSNNMNSLKVKKYTEEEERL